MAGVVHDDGVEVPELADGEQSQLKSWPRGVAATVGAEDFDLEALRLRVPVDLDLSRTRARLHGLAEGFECPCCDGGAHEIASRFP